MKTKLALVLVIMLVACAVPATSKPVPPSSTPILPTATLPPLLLTPTSPATNTLISLTKDGTFTSEPFKVTEKSLLRVNWQQACKSKFTLVIQNTDPAQNGTPNGEVTFNKSAVPSAYFQDYPFIPGQYIIKVESDGPWTVWVEYVSPIN